MDFMSVAAGKTVFLGCLLLAHAGLAGPQPYAGTLETALADANAGDTQALYFLGKCYSKGEHGAPQDFVRAAEFLRKAAEKGSAYAQNDLAALYARGRGVKQDYEEAAKWYRKAAEQGDPLAQYSMGRICEQGRGVPRDLEVSLKWYRKAAAHDQPDALLILGDIYLKGNSATKSDPREAFRCFQRAVRLGRTEALNSLGYLYEGGNGFDESGASIGRSVERAVACYREAALKGDGRGQMNLGRMYLNGWGVTNDLVEAYKWFNLAVTNGDLTAEKYLRDFELGDALSAEQLAEGKRRAEEFQKTFRGGH